MLKSKKVIIFILSVVIIFSLFCFPASADTTETFENFFSDIRVNALLIDPDNYENVRDVTGNFSFKFQDNILYCYVTNNFSFPSSSWLKFSVEFTLSNRFNQNGYSFGRFWVTTYQARASFSQQMSFLNYSNRSNGNWSFDNNLTLDTNGRYIIVDIPKNSSPQAFKTLDFSCVLTTQVASYSGMVFELQFSNLDYTFLSPEGYLVDSITQNQDENTQAIIDNQNQLQENEKNEAQNSGSSASDDVAAAVPDQSAGFTNALKTFVQGMSTTDTECNIKLPAIVVPELKGLVPETALIDEQSINFSQAVSLIPESIMKIVQSLTTIALIVFCFKELYGTIEYILTMRKGGSSE